MNYDNQINSIKSRDEFIKFVRDLALDFKENSAGWENDNLGTYLDALAAWAGDMDGYYNNIGEPSFNPIPWKFIAQLLAAAKHYE